MSKLLESYKAWIERQRAAGAVRRMRRWERIRSKGKTFLVTSFGVLFALLNATYQLIESGLVKEAIGFLIMTTPVAFIIGVAIGAMWWETGEGEYRKHLGRKPGVK